jgi:hypothetical protein
MIAFLSSSKGVLVAVFVVVSQQENPRDASSEMAASHSEVLRPSRN